MPLATTRVDLETIMLSEVRERQIYDIIHIWNLIFKVIQMNLFTKQKQISKYRGKKKIGFQRGNVKGRDKSRT